MTYFCCCLWPLCISPFHVRLNSVIYLTKKSIKMSKILSESRNPESRIINVFLLFFMGFKSLPKENPCHIKHYTMDNQAQHSIAVLHHVLPESTFKDKKPQGMELVCITVIFLPKVAQGMPLFLWRSSGSSAKKAQFFHPKKIMGTSPLTGRELW